MDSTAKFITLLMLIPVVCVLVATVLDVWDPFDRSTNLFRHVFSPRQSLKSLLSTRASTDGHSFDSLYGIRLILSLLIVWTHTHLYLYHSMPIKNYLKVNDAILHRLLNLRNHAIWPMNTFFFLSGGKTKRVAMYVLVFLGLSSFCAQAIMIALRKTNIIVTTHDMTDADSKRIPTDHDVRRFWCQLFNSILGILLGYLLKNHRDRIKTNAFVTLWGLSFPAIIVVSMAVMGCLTKVDQVMPLHWQIVYMSLGNIIWQLMAVWVFLHCHFTPKSWINLVISHRYLVPIGKLSFAIYLANQMVLMARFYSLSEPLLLSDVTLTFEFVRASVLSICVGAVMYVVVESPWERLQRFIFTSSR